FEEQLFATDEGKSVGLSYFKRRGFREETMRKFGLGFAPNVRDAFTKTALAAGYKQEQLEKLGLSKYKRDFFYDRVMFTIHNLSGKPIAFAGRILKKDVKAPKYVNSPETEIYHKSDVLYGMFQAKQSIRKLDNVYLVEGYTDVISLHQNGVENVVASSGTSLTAGQVSLIKRFTQNVTLLYDGDKAGIKAALRGVDILLDQDMSVRCVLLPDGEDPDSYLQAVGSTAFQDYLDQEKQDFLLFKAQLLLEDAANDLGGKTAVIQNLSESLARINQPLKRSEYIKQLAERLDIQENLLVGQINKAVSARQKQLHQEQQRKKWREEREHKREVANKAPLPDAPPPQGNADFPTEQPPWVEEAAASGFTDAAPPFDAPTSEEELAIGHTFQERYLAILLMRDGAKIYSETPATSVAQFLLVNVLDVIEDFDSLLYRQIVEETQRYLSEKKEPPPIDHFLQHEDKRIRQLAIDCCVSRYETSPNWVKRYGKYLSQKVPEENQIADSEKFIRIFRQEKIHRKIEENKRRLKELQQQNAAADQIILHMKLHQKLIKLRQDVIDPVGVKIVPPRHF
ncbi:MAG: toprim domain-containing protein, partial [Bacteroidota bacterium]